MTEKNSNSKLFKMDHIWSWALRIFHWTFAISIVILVLTGLVIHDPPVISTFTEERTNFFFAYIRYLHFVAGYFLISALILRLYLLFFGNRYERVTDFVPISRGNLRSLMQTLKFYLYLTPHSESARGHNVLAGTVYVVTFLFSFVMVFTGLYMLYPETGWIKSLGSFLFGTQQVARAIHYLFFWFFPIFILTHLYILIWHEIMEPEGLISSIFSGKKFFRTNSSPEKGNSQLDL